MSKRAGYHFSGIRACIFVSGLRAYWPMSWSMAYSIQSCSHNIQNALAYDVRKSHLQLELLDAVYLDAVNDRDDRTQAHGNVHKSSEGPPVRRPEFGQSDHS